MIEEYWRWNLDSLGGSGGDRYWDEMIIYIIKREWRDTDTRSREKYWGEA